MSEANAALLPQNMLQSVLKWEPELLPDALSGDLWRFYEVLEPELSAEHSTKREVSNMYLCIWTVYVHVMVLCLSSLKGCPM